MLTYVPVGSCTTVTLQGLSELAASGGQFVSPVFRALNQYEAPALFCPGSQISTSVPSGAGVRPGTLSRLLPGGGDRNM